MSIETDNAGTFLRKKSSGKNYLFMQKGKPKAKALSVNLKSKSKKEK